MFPSAPSRPPLGPRSDPSRSLQLSDRFPCPLCRHGDLEALVLTEAFACNFCRHILTADLLNQRVQVVDSNQPLVWQWTGQRWRSCHQPAAALTPLVWITAGLLLFAPAGLVAGASYLFPPLDPTPGWSFGAVWAIATLALHLLLVLWLLAEHYQLPLYVATKVRIQRQRQREREAG